ncbi:hypothetical protein [Jatrophihabitans sp.]|uniref:hypothetical protein n=1 Tax=Jatrophihabitans sp. TaxID=1932789 RepID=UPI002B9D12E5|nr:hypothetical protein [Jatrophihabitans sp.]
MTDLHIARLSATTTAQDEARVRRLLTGVTERRLEPVLAGLDLPPGEWCIRRLDVPLSLADRQADATVETAWALALVAALREALEHGPDAGVVHYRRPAAALADLLAGLATGAIERLWAWRQLGLLQPGDPDPAGMPVAALLAVLRRRPAEAVPALVTAARTAGVAALHRLLGPAGWNELARQVIAGVGGDPALAIPPDRPWSTGPLPERGTLPTTPSATGPAGESGPPPASASSARRLADAVVRRSVLGQAATRSRLRPDQVTAWAWAALTAAEVDPALFVRPTARLVLARLAAGYQGMPAARPLPGAPAAGGPESSAPDPGKLTGQPERRRADAADPSGRPVTGDGISDQTSDKTSTPDTRTDGAGRPADAPAGPEPERFPAENGWPTDWAGLPFFLTTADQAELPGALLADEVLAGRPLSWTVYQLGQLLVPAIDPADPALFALAGLVPAPLPLDPPTPAEADRLAGHAERWAAVTATRLGGEPAPDLAAVAQDLAARPGVVAAEPGWIEIHLSLDGVRLDVRRAGLDVDPGWLRWLTAVVTFVYE